MSNQNVWLIGGTSDSKTIAQMLASQTIPVVVTVTTASAKNLYSSHPYLKIIVGKIQATDIHQFMQQHQLTIIIDASHPYAVKISAQVIAIAQQYGYPYLRYERPQIMSNQTHLTYFSSISSLLSSDSLQGRRVLLTIGAKSLHLFRNYQSQATLFTRILPYADSLQKAAQAGFSSDRIIAIRPPLNYQFEKALWQLWQIDTVVTKASGQQGGENLKQQLAKDLGLNLMIIQRPPLNYPQKTEKIESVLTFCCQFLLKSKISQQKH